MLTNDVAGEPATTPSFVRLERVCRFLVENAKEIRNATIAAAVGAVVSQVAFPALAPYVDLYSFAVFGASPWNPRFLVVASVEDVLLRRTNPGDLLSVTRLFCGGTKLCVTRQIAPDRMKGAAAWPFDPDDKERVKTLVIGHDDSVFTAAYVDQKSSKPGYLELPGQLAVSGDFVGKGMGCHINMKTNEATTGLYYAYVGEIAHQIDGIDARVMAAADYDAAVDKRFVDLFARAEDGKAFAGAPLDACG